MLRRPLSKMVCRNAHLLCGEQKRFAHIRPMSDKNAAFCRIGSCLTMTNVQCAAQKLPAAARSNFSSVFFGCFGTRPLFAVAHLTVLNLLATSLSFSPGFARASTLQLNYNPVSLLYYDNRCSVFRFAICKYLPVQAGCRQLFVRVSVLPGDQNSPDFRYCRCYSQKYCYTTDWSYRPIKTEQTAPIICRHFSRLHYPQKKAELRTIPGFSQSAVVVHY